MAFYQELYDCLTNLKDNKITFTLSKLNKLINNKLPASAETHYQPFFSNGNGNGYNPSWRRAGFIAKYDPKTKKVTFFREGSEAVLKPKSKEKSATKAKAPIVKDNCIVLNKSFTGEWLNKDENNVAHEIVNFFKADDNNVYIYNTPYGANVDNSGNLNIKFLYMTTSKPHGVYFLEYCVVIKESLHDCTISRKYQNIEYKDKLREVIAAGKKEINNRLGKSYDNVKYGGIPVEQLFDDTIDVFPFTYIAEKVYKAIKPIPVDEDALTKDGEMDYNFARNFGYVLESEEPKAYKHLLELGPTKKPRAWEEISLPKFKMLNQYLPANERILQSLVQNSFLDMIDNFKLEECYTKMLFKLMNYDHAFINTFLEETIGNPFANVHFVPNAEFDAKEYGRMDIYAEDASNRVLLVIENKIDSSITIDGEGASQLLRYCQWANTFRKNWRKIYIIIAPDYRLGAVTSEVDHLRERESFNKYTICGYSKIYNALLKHKTKNNFLSFKYNKYLNDIELLLLRMAMDRKTLYTAKISKRILSLKRK